MTSPTNPEEEPTMIDGLKRQIPVGTRAARKTRRELHHADVEAHGYCLGCGETDDCLGRFEGEK